MRIYNATNSTLCIPYGRRGEILTIASKTPSGNILGSTDLLTNLITSFTPKEIAFIVNGPFEINVVANIAVASQYVVQSLDEAIQRFAPKEEVKKEKKIVIKKESEVKKEEAQAPVVEEKPVEEQPKEEEKQPEAVAIEEQEVEVVEVKEKKPRKKKTTKAKKSE